MNELRKWLKKKIDEFEEVKISYANTQNYQEAHDMQTYISALEDVLYLIGEDDAD